VAAVDDLMAARDSLAAEIKGETARRAALVAAGKPAVATYSVGGKSVSWGEWLGGKVKEMTDLNALIQAMGGDGGLYEEHQQVYSG